MTRKSKVTLSTQQKLEYAKLTMPLQERVALFHTGFLESHVRLYETLILALFVNQVNH